jgi:transposase InsO family protein
MAQVRVVQDPPQENAVLFTGFNKRNAAELCVEARNCAVLDCACSSTVCGEDWLQSYIESLGEEDQQKVQCDPGEKVFKFGGGEIRKSKGSYCIPAFLAGQNVTVRTDVVDSDIPLLLSNKAMKRAKVKLDLENDTAQILGVEIALNHTSSGHYCVPIDKSEQMKVESVCAVKLYQMNPKDRYQALLKLHRQFAHPPVHRLRALMMDAGAWRDDFAEDLKIIYDKCQICKLYAKTPCRPAVALPMATRFNEKVCMDLKKWQDKWILHMIDMYSRFSVSVFISRKTAREVLDKVMTCWVGAAFGVMEALMVDNGGEFNSGETREVASILNIEMCTTAAESPFQNGLCERNHAVTDMMLLRMVEQCPDTPLEVLLCWANMAKNSLQMWHGYSSYQIVFGRNPNLPNVMTENVPALAGSTSSEVLAEHLNALHAARKAFVESEADERIRRALRCKVRASEQVFNNGDRVYYKRESQERWLGPGKVVFQDGRVVFVRHGNVFVRVSPNRLIKAGNEMISDGVECEKPGDERYVEVSETHENGKEKASVRESIIKDHADLQEPAIGDQEGSNEKTVVKNDKIQYKVSPGGEWISATVLGRGGKLSGQYKNWYNIKDDTSGEEKCLDLENVED